MAKMGFYALVVLLLIMSVHNTIPMIFFTMLLLASVIYEVLLSVKDSMLL